MQEDLKIVERQIKASNSGDIEKCLSYWADDLKVIILPENKTAFSSKQEVREHLEKDFADKTNYPTVKIHSSEVDGSCIHLIEEKFRDGKSTGKMKFTYLVEDGLITTMWGHTDTLSE